MIDNLNGIVTQHQAQAEQITDADLPDRPRVKDVARWLGVHRNTIYTLMHKGDIPYKVIGKRTYIFDRVALLDWWAEQEAA